MPAIEFRNLARRNPVSALRAWRVEVEALGIDSAVASHVGNGKFASLVAATHAGNLHSAPVSALDDIEVGNWLTIVSTIKGSSFILQQVTSTTTGLRERQLSQE